MTDNRRKVKQRVNPNFTKDFFEKINTPEKAYWLGYLYMVGEVHEDGYVLMSRSLNSDMEALVRFCMDTRLSTNIHQHTIEYSKTGVDSLTYYIGFMSKEFSEGFWGYLPGGDANRNKNPRYPNISPEYNRHFIRGLFESFSSVIQVSSGRRNSYYIRFDGFERMLESVQEILREEIQMDSYLTEKDFEQGRFTHRLVLSSIRALPDLILYLYDGVERYNRHKNQQLMDVFNYVFEEK